MAGLDQEKVIVAVAFEVAEFLDVLGLVGAAGLVMGRGEGGGSLGFTHLIRHELDALQ